jgi:hypothetical protein
MENSNELIGLGRSMREGQREVIPIRDYVVEPVKPVQHPFAGGEYRNFIFRASPFRSILSGEEFLWLK